MRTKGILVKGRYSLEIQEKEGGRDHWKVKEGKILGIKEFGSWQGSLENERGTNSGEQGVWEVAGIVGK